MQKMIPVALVAAAFTVRSVGALSSRAVSVTQGQSSEWRACLEAEAEDTQFWAGEWQDMETELLQLQAAALGTPVAQAAAAKPADAKAKHRHHFNPLAGIKLNLEPKSPADLVPALAMLKGLYEDGKERIGDLNAREQKLKGQYEKKKAQHDQRIVTIDARFKSHTLSEEFHTNETRDETRLWTYWQHVRERQHRQFHTSLKIQHATLTKVKQMMDMYEKTIAGKEDKKTLRKEFIKVTGHQVAPEVVFLQSSARGLAKFCGEQLQELRTERAAASVQTDAAPQSQVA